MADNAFEDLSEALDGGFAPIEGIERARASRVVVLFDFEWGLFSSATRMLTRAVRDIGETDRLDLVLDSGGGSVDAAAKIVKVSRAYASRLSVLVPSYAKSAAALIALSADEIVMSRSGELGNVDPQVRPPGEPHYMVPAHSIEEALDLIESQKDPFLKLSLADKLDPLLLGAFKDAQAATRQYVEEALAGIGDAKKREEAIEAFSLRFRSHGYPIDRQQCCEWGLPVAEVSEELEDLMCDLLEDYAAAISPHLSPQQGVIVVQNASAAYVAVGSSSFVHRREKPTEEGQQAERGPDGGAAGGGKEA